MNYRLLHARPVFSTPLLRSDEFAQNEEIISHLFVELYHGCVSTYNWHTAYVVTFLKFFILTYYLFILIFILQLAKET